MMRIKVQEARRNGKSARIVNGKIEIENETWKWNVYNDQLEKSKN